MNNTSNVSSQIDLSQWYAETLSEESHKSIIDHTAITIGCGWIVNFDKPKVETE